MKALLLLILAFPGLTAIPLRAQPMPANANPSFEVATIKPTGEDLVGAAYGMQGHVFSTRNTSLSYLLAYSNDMQQNQIIGAPAWADTDKFDIKAEPDILGQPKSSSNSKHGPRSCSPTASNLPFPPRERKSSSLRVVLDSTALKLARAKTLPPPVQDSPFMDSEKSW